MTSHNIYIAGAVVFQAGILFAGFRALRRDVNGLGKKYGRVVALLVRWADTEEKRDQVARLVEGK